MDDFRMVNKIWKLYDKVFVFLICYIIVVVFVILKVYLDDFLNLNIGSLPLPLKIEFLKKPIEICFFAIVIAPLFEETIFRLPLVKNKSYLISLVFLLLFTLTLKLRFLQLVCSVLFFLALIYQNYTFKYVKYVLISYSVIAFGLIHLDNYDLELLIRINKLQTIFLFISQLFFGVFATYIRFKIGFKSSVLFHSLYNLTLIILELTINK